MLLEAAIAARTARYDNHPQTFVDTVLRLKPIGATCAECSKAAVATHAGSPLCAIDFLDAVSAAQ
jgi:hypothetical protein